MCASHLSPGACTPLQCRYIAPPSGRIRITLTPKDVAAQVQEGKQPEDVQKDKKPYKVTLMLAVIMHHMEGNMLFKVCRISLLSRQSPHMDGPRGRASRENCRSMRSIHLGYLVHYPHEDFKLCNKFLKCI